METHAIGIDIGGTNLRFALVDSLGRIMHRSRTVSRIEQGRDAFCRRLLDGIAEMRGFAGRCGASVVGIGAGVPGLLDKKGLIRSSVNMRPLDGFDLSAYLEQQTGFPVVCGNDANLIALGEYIHGAGRGLESFVVITVGTGLGSGLVLEGRLWTGVGGFAAEFGHVTVEPDGVPCPCGNRGCLEQYASAGAIVRTARQLLGSELPGIIADSLNAEKVAGLARQGQTAALAAFEEAGHYLGIALASLVNTLNLEAAVICGGVAASLDLLLPPLRNELENRCFPQIAADFSVIAGELGDDAGLLGAAAIIRAHVKP
jgi:glucokinase